MNIKLAIDIFLDWPGGDGLKGCFIGAFFFGIFDFMFFVHFKSYIYLCFCSLLKLVRVSSMVVKQSVFFYGSNHG